MRKRDCVLKLLDLNIALYNGWSVRMPEIVRLIREHGPDVVALQEVMDDAKFNKYGDNQAKQLARALGFGHCAVYLSSNLRKESPQWVGDRRAREGNAILSRYPLRDIVKRRLKRQACDRHCRGFVYARVMAPVPFTIMVVHFTNDDVFSVLHLKEALAYAERAKLRPIIVGDFNIRDTKAALALTPKGYTLSYAAKRYVSHPKTGETLDDIMLPEGMRFRSLQSIDKKLSDHCALVAEIE